MPFPLPFGNILLQSIFYLFPIDYVSEYLFIHSACVYLLYPSFMYYNLNLILMIYTYFWSAILEAITVKQGQDVSIRWKYKICNILWNWSITDPLKNITFTNALLYFKTQQTVFAGYITNKSQLYHKLGESNVWPMFFILFKNHIVFVGSGTKCT